MLPTRTATHRIVGHCHEVGVSLSSRVEAKPQALIPSKEAAHRTITEGGWPRLPPFGGGLSGLLPRRGFWLEGPGLVQALSCGRVTWVTQKPKISPPRGRAARAAQIRFWYTRLRSVSCVLEIIFAGFWFCTIRKYIILSTRDCQGGLTWQRIQRCLHRFLSSSMQGTQEGEHK